jgi:hypothetical protein
MRTAANSVRSVGVGAVGAVMRHTGGALLWHYSADDGERQKQPPRGLHHLYRQRDHHSPVRILQSIQEEVVAAADIVAAVAAAAAGY